MKLAQAVRNVGSAPKDMMMSPVRTGTQSPGQQLDQATDGDHGEESA
jgi:hypothetical protein